MNRSLSQLSYRPIYEAVLFPVRCYDPENIDIIAAFGTFVKAFFQIPAQMRRLLLSAKEVITSDALIFYPQKRRKRRRYGMNSYNIELEDRKIIEEMYNAGAKPCEIAARIGKCQATIYREIKRGEVPELNARCRPAYRAEVAEKRVTEAYRKRGRRKATE